MEKVTTDQELLDWAKRKLFAIANSKHLDSDAAVIGNEMIRLIELHIQQSSAPDEEFNTALCFANEG